MLSESRQNINWWRESSKQMKMAGNKKMKNAGNLKC
jgi:hypothetical protein